MDCPKLWCIILRQITAMEPLLCPDCCPFLCFFVNWNILSTKWEVVLKSDKNSSYCVKFHCGGPKSMYLYVYLSTTTATTTINIAQLTLSVPFIWNKIRKIRTFRPSGVHYWRPQLVNSNKGILKHYHFFPGISVFNQYVGILPDFA